jgi:integrase
VNCYVRAIKVLFSSLHREEPLPVNPLALAKAPKMPVKLVDPFSEADLQRIFKALKGTAYPYRNTATALFLLDTGVRLLNRCGM